MTAVVEAPDPSAHERGAARRPWWWGALAGLLAVGAALAVGELVTGIVAGTSSAVVSVGEVVIENAPSWLKDYAIETFGERDKDALIVGTTVVLVVLSIVLGIASRRRLWIGVVGTALLGIVGAWAALTRPGADTSAVWPSLLGSVAGIGVLWLLLGRHAPSAAPAAGSSTGAAAGSARATDPEPVPTGSTSDPEPVPAGSAAGSSAAPVLPSTMRPARTGANPAPTGFDRRKFLISAGLVAGGSVVVAGAGRRLQDRYDVAGARRSIVLPAPASPATALPADVELGTDGISPFMTSDADFYRVDTALVVPQVDPAGWSLSIGGMVDSPMELSFEDLLDRELVERDVTLVCVSNEVGGQYASNGRWLGVPLRSLLEEAGVQAGANQLVSRSTDGWTAGSPTDVVMDGRDALVAIGLNGEPLSAERGFPARLVVPGLYGFTSATKWVTQLELTTFDAFDPYWVQRGWAQVAPIKTMARIDTPKGLANLDPGTVAIGGVAWAPHRGIEAVEVRVDDGPWQQARLGAVPTADTWRQWVLPWEATPGRHTLVARATDGTGEVQTDQRAQPIPDGASGWHSVVVTVR